MKIPRKKVIVTGGAGFIGSHLVDRLIEDGHEVHVIDNLSSGNSKNLNTSAFLHEYDIREPDSISKIFKDAQLVFHLAAIVSVPYSVEHPEETFSVNVDGTRNIFDLCYKNSVRKVVYASSAAVYGNTHRIPKVETMDNDLPSPYAEHKATNEVDGQKYNRKFGLSTTGLRFFNVFGPRQDSNSPYSGVVSLFVNNIKSGSGINIFGDGEQTRDFVFISDIIDGIIAAAQSKCASGKVYNLGSGTEVSLNDAVSVINEILDSRTEPEYGPERYGDIKRSVSDITKAKQDFGYKPKVSFAEGIRRMIL